MSKLILIAAMTTDKVIGVNGDLPWRIPSDLAFFKQVTTGNTIVMGRKTFESVGSRPLPGRMNIVLTREVTEGDRELEDAAEERGENLLFMTDESFKLFSFRHNGDIYIAGGAEIYDHFLNNYFISELLISRIHASYEEAEDEVATYFPKHEFPANLWTCELIKKSRKWQRGNERDSHEYDIYLYTKTLEQGSGIITSI